MTKLIAFKSRRKPYKRRQLKNSQQPIHTPRLPDNISLQPILEPYSESSNNPAPELKLLAAVLSHAIVEAFGTTRVDGYTRRQAKEWLFGWELQLRANKQRYKLKPWSFLWICEHLDVHPHIVTKAIKNLTIMQKTTSQNLNLVINNICSDDFPTYSIS